MKNKKIIIVSMVAVALVAIIIFVGRGTSITAEELSIGTVKAEIKEEVYKELDEKYNALLIEKQAKIDALQEQINTFNSNQTALEQKLREEIQAGDKAVEGKITYANVEQNRQATRDPNQIIPNTSSVPSSSSSLPPAN